jgi:TM2 domain-containing membrane protein YozV
MAEVKPGGIPLTYPRSAGLAVFLGLLLPGAGHWYLGMRGKAILFCACLLAMFAIGMVLSYGDAIDPIQHPWFFLGQAFIGPVSIIGWVIGIPERSAVLLAPRLVDLGMVFTVVAGALNVVLMCDAYARAAHLKREQAQK